MIFDVSSELDNETESETEDEQPNTENVDKPPRRSSGQRRQPVYYGREQSHLTTETPTTLTEANASRDRAMWKVAMNTEMKSLKDNDVWDLVELPSRRKKVGRKWVFKMKTGSDSKIERYKARLVAQGFTQKFGSNYDETFCPVARQESLRVLLALSVQYGLKLHQIDVAPAFLNSNLEEEVYMAQPEGFVSQGREHLVCKLKKSIYGLKQSPRCWNTALRYLSQENWIHTIE